MVQTRAEADELLGTSLEKIESGFGKEDLRLRDWVMHLDVAEFAALIAVIEDRWLNDLKTSRWLKVVWIGQNKLLSPFDREVGATLLVHELREYSGHTFNVFTKKPHYEEVLPRIHDRVATQLKKPKPPSVASVSFRERAITELLAGEALASLSTDELAEALNGLDVPDKVKQNAGVHLGQALAGGGLAGVVKVVGKKVIKDVILRVVEGLLVKKLGKKAAAEIIKKIAAKVPQKVFAQGLAFIGIALIAWDVISLGSEATRVTTPLVISLSLYRTIDSIDAT